MVALNQCLSGALYDRRVRLFRNKKDSKCVGAWFPLTSLRSSSVDAGGGAPGQPQVFGRSKQ